MKRVMKWCAWLTLIYLVLFFGESSFTRDWRIMYSEMRVQKSIVKNYSVKEEKFGQLIEYVRNLAITSPLDIEFKNRHQINAYLGNPFKADSIKINSAFIDLALCGMEGYGKLGAEFEILPNGIARIDFIDTIIETGHWYWNFEGGYDSPSFKKFIHYLGISQCELDTLRRFIKEANCEAISINQDGSFSLRYDGFSECQYEYFIPISEIYVPKHYSRLDDGIYYGLNRADLFCGDIIYDK